MGGDVMSLATEMTPYVSAAVGAYGGAVLAKLQMTRRTQLSVLAAACCSGSSDLGARGSRCPRR